MPSSTATPVTVSEVMHYGVITAPPQATLVEAAEEMARNDVHCLVVEGVTRRHEGHETLVWGILSDLDLMQAVAADRLDATAGEVAASEIVTVDSTDGIGEVAQLMAEHQNAHLVVVSPETGEPIGVVSSLDVARGLSGPRGRAG
jgi:CBS domain-containing protein